MPTASFVYSLSALKWCEIAQYLGQSTGKPERHGGWQSKDHAGSGGFEDNASVVGRQVEAFSYFDVLLRCLRLADRGRQRPSRDECYMAPVPHNAALTGGRRAARAGNRTAAPLFGAPVERLVMRHCLHGKPPSTCDPNPQLDFPSNGRSLLPHRTGSIVKSPYLLATSLSNCQCFPSKRTGYIFPIG
jgi:hypothetical protein